MSASTMMEPFDMPMTDYIEDGDIPMAGSSSENSAWFQAFAHMDEDAHHIDATSESQEVDMVAFEETTTEYEMADENAEPQVPSVDTNVIDAEVYDAAFQSSLLPHAQIEAVENPVIQARISESNVPSVEQTQEESGSNHPATSQCDAIPSQHFPPSDGAQVIDVQPPITDDHPSEHASSINAPENNNEYHENGNEHNGESIVHSVHVEGVSNVGEANFTAHSEPLSSSLRSDASEGHPEGEDDAKVPDLSTSNLASVHEESAIGDRPEGDETILAQQATEEMPSGLEGHDIGQSEVQANHQAYVQPPPIFLSLQVTSTEGDQPDFVLFSLPEGSSNATDEPLVLLQHHPTLFYEPVSSVFEAFRREEYFSHLEELSEAEMALNAYDLQLVISEDNIYAREVSLQDLYAMHQGVGLSGHLRLTLQSVVPRFISRYNLLRDQITRLVLAEETEDTQQHVAVPTHEDEEECDTQEHTDAAESVHAAEHADEADHQGENSEVANEDDDVEDDEPETREDMAKGEQDESDHVEEAAPENEDSGHGDEQEDVTSGVPDAATEAQDQQAVPEDNADDDANDADASGEEDDEAYDLDADPVPAPGGEDSTGVPPEEHAAEYVDVTELGEEGDEGYVDEFKEDGEEIAGTVDIANEVVETSHDEDVDKVAVQEADDNQSGATSHSTSTSSFDADDSSWEDAVGELEEEENEEPGDEEQETNLSTQRNAVTVFDEEGNYTQGFESGEGDFGAGNFEGSAENTFENTMEERKSSEDNVDATEVMEKDDDDTSRAVLAESEKFVSTLANDDEDSVDSKTRDASNDDVEPEELREAVGAKATLEKPAWVNKNASKRSLDDAELGNEEIVELPSSPDSKRTRTL